MPKGYWREGWNTLYLVWQTNRATDLLGIMGCYCCYLVHVCAAMSTKTQTMSQWFVLHNNLQTRIFNLEK